MLTCKFNAYINRILEAHAKDEDEEDEETEEEVGIARRYPSKDHEKADKLYRREQIRYLRSKGKLPPKQTI